MVIAKKLNKLFMIKNLLVFAFLFLTITFCFGQNEILVELNDSETAEPLAYATIRFKGGSRGLVSDYYGQFRLLYKSVDSLPVILITSMGYKSLEVDTKTLSLNVLNKIKVEPQIESLDTIILNVSKRDRIKSENISNKISEGGKKSASEIVDMAISKIPLHLSNLPHSYIGYYRDYQLVDNTYHNLNEGILEQYEAGISTYKISDTLNQNVFYRFNKNNDFVIDEELAAAYSDGSKFIENAQIGSFGGNELTILNVHNPIRNFNRNTFSYVYQMNEDFLDNHIFRKGKIEFINDEPIIKISFSTKASTQKNNYTLIDNNIRVSNHNKVSGVISISLEDFAIYDFGYKVYEGRRQKPLFNVDIQYRKENRKMYLNYITFNNRFVLEDAKPFMESNIIYDKTDNAFDIEFNNSIDPSTVKSKNFKIRYKGINVLIESVIPTSKKSVRVNISDFDGVLSGLQDKDLTNIKVKMKRLKDFTGAKIYKPKLITAYQFREFFVQEVFTDKMLRTDLSFISKVRPLDKAQINSLESKVDYIINSPLQEVDLINDN